jgi:hypothetical protein
MKVKDAVVGKIYYQILGRILKIKRPVTTGRFYHLKSNND